MNLRPVQKREQAVGQSRLKKATVAAVPPAQRIRILLRHSCPQETKMPQENAWRAINCVMLTNCSERQSTLTFTPHSPGTHIAYEGVGCVGPVTVSI